MQPFGRQRPRCELSCRCDQSAKNRARTQASSETRRQAHRRGDAADPQEVRPAPHVRRTASALLGRHFQTASHPGCTLLAGARPPPQSVHRAGSNRRWPDPRESAVRTTRTGNRDGGAPRISAAGSLSPTRSRFSCVRFPPNGFAVFLTLFSKYFSPFPHGTGSLSVSCRYLALDGVFHPL